MSTPAPVRSGFRMAGPDVPVAIYAHPPLVESWLGVEFSEPTGLSVADSAKLRTALGPEWPGAWKPVSQGIAPHGLQLTNVMGDRALRLTSRGFKFGWLGYSGERYPQYESVRDGFVTVLDAVRKFPGEAGTGLIPQTWSVCYVNRVPRGTVWCTPGEWTFFNLWQPGPLAGLGVDPIGSRARWDFPLDAERGHLTIEFQHSLEKSDDAEAVWLCLSASGAVEQAETSLFDGLDFGREVIVRGFNELVSTDAKTYWGVRSR